MQPITYKYRLYPRHSQIKALLYILTVARYWYNMCLAERKYAYELEGRSVSKKDQLRLVKHYKKTMLGNKQVHSHVLQVATNDLDKAMKKFFKWAKGKKKAGEKVGYPRFKSASRFHSFGFKEHGNGFKVIGNRLHITGVGKIPIRMHRPLPEGAVIKTIRIKYQAGQWFVSIVITKPPSEELPKTGRYVGIDVGITSLITTSDGEKIDNPKYYGKAQKQLRKVQRALKRKVKGSKNYKKNLKRLQRVHGHVANQRSDFLHKISTYFVQNYDGIAIEDLRITNMVKNRHLSKSILDSGWGILKQYFTYKAVSANRALLIINPTNTSKWCSNCGCAFENFTLSTRWVECEQCGLSLDRDHNAAINILRKGGWDAPVLVNVGGR
ncbi:MAG: transposase [bacterium]|nr:transposase [bacterium]